MSGRAVVVWQLADGKRGHERQSEGLIAALADRVALDARRIDVTASAASNTWDALRARFPAGRGLPAPDLVVGAGRACHWPLVAVRRAYRVPAVCLMRPGLPWRWFDLCVVPRHDRPREAANVIASEGPLNPLRPAADKDPALGVVLLGGPSAHHRFDVGAVLEQAQRAMQRAPQVRWHLTDSRRSPGALRAAIAADPELAARFTASDTCAPDWLPGLLARAGHAVVTADSMAMIYEALTAGAALSLIALEARRDDRITAIAPALIARGWAVAAGEPPRAPVTLDEAGRVADALLARWPALGDGA